MLNDLTTSPMPSTNLPRAEPSVCPGQAFPSGPAARELPISKKYLCCGSFKLSAGGALALSVLASTAAAQERPFTAGGTGEPPPPVPPPPQSAEAVKAEPGPAPSANPLENVLSDKIPDAIRKGKFNLNIRLRYEQVDTDNLPPFTKDSYAPTLRTRFGFTTAPLYGFQAMLEGVNVTVLGPEHNYNAAGSNGQGARPPVGDPPLTRVDQAWLAWSYTNLFRAKVGEQQIFLDNRRFIADVGWRQNIQTYDAAQLQGQPIKNLDLYYAYLWQVHRVFGDVPGLPAPNTDYDSDSHVLHATYRPCSYANFAAYSYLLDLSNAAGNADSCATYGASFNGVAPVADKVMLNYRAEFAWQNDYADSPLSYSAPYYNFEAGANYRPIAAGGGIELLGSGANSGAGGGRAGFRTPLATLHAFNGWADVFPNTPADGLRDIYGYFQVTLPAKIPVRFVYHKYDADHGDADFGQEFDVLVTKRFAKYWNALLEYAYYDGRDAAPPAFSARDSTVQKFWAAVEFNF